MRLSDAIALGRTILKPRKGTFRQGDTGCALGMGLIAIGSEIFDERVLNARWPWLRLRKGMICEHGVWCTAGLIIIHLFDDHVMARPSTMTLDGLINWIRENEPTEEVSEPEVKSNVEEIAYVSS